MRLPLVFLCAVLFLLPGAESARAADTATPVLVSVALADASPKAPGDTVAVNYTANDPGGSGLSSAIFYFRTPVGGLVQVRADGPAAAAGPATFAIPTFAAAGAYSLFIVTLIDDEGNGVDYNLDGSVTLSPGGASGPPSPHPFDFAATTFEVTNPGQDVTTPLVSAFSLASPGPFAPGMTVVMDYTASDGSGSGISSAVFYFEDLLGGLRQVRADGVAAGTGPATATVDANWVGGTHVLKYIDLIDNAGNSTSLQPDGSVLVQPPGAAGPPNPHGFIFANTTFSVDNPGADTFTPRLTTFEIVSPPRYKAGSTIMLNYTATDPGGTAISSVIFQFEGPLGEQRQVRADGPGAPAGPASATVGANWPGGLYTLGSISLGDGAGNSASYLPGGSVDIQPPGADGPAGHSFDFGAFTFAVITFRADVGCNGTIELADAAYHLAALAETVAVLPPCTGDVDEDSDTDPADTLLILVILAGLAPPQ